MGIVQQRPGEQRMEEQEQELHAAGYCRWPEETADPAAALVVEAGGEEESKEVRAPVQNEGK
jgi:hypothetical protein